MTEHVFIWEIYIESYEEYIFKKLFDRLHNLYSEKNAIELLSGDFPSDKKKDKKKKGKRKSQQSGKESKRLHFNNFLEENESNLTIIEAPKNVELESKYKNFLSKIIENK